MKTIEGVDEECAAGALKETRHQVEHDISETRGSRDQVVRRARAVVCATMRLCNNETAVVLSNVRYECTRTEVYKVSYLAI